MSELQRTEKEILAKALELDKRAVFPKPNQLFIDIDSSEELARHETAWEVARLHVKGMRRRIRPSETEGHYHITVTLPYELPVYERLSLQFALGDDPKRAVLTWLRAREGEENPSVFFEVK